MANELQDALNRMSSLYNDPKNEASDSIREDLKKIIHKEAKQLADQKNSNDDKTASINRRNYRKMKQSIKKAKPITAL